MPALSTGLLFVTVYWQLAPVVSAEFGASLPRGKLYGARASVFILGGALIFTATNILYSTVARYLIERLFLRSRLKEALLFLLAIVGLAPQIFLLLNVRKSMLFRFAPSQLLWPWAAIARHAAAAAHYAERSGVVAVSRRCLVFRAVAV